jgi:hypothetical protein
MINIFILEFLSELGMKTKFFWKTPLYFFIYCGNHFVLRKIIQSGRFFPVIKLSTLVFQATVEINLKIA